MCKLHTNELPLRHVIEKIDGPTTGTNSFAGPLGKLICGEVHKLEFDPAFKSISPPFPLRELPAEVVNDLSTDQHYAY